MPQLDLLHRTTMTEENIRCQHISIIKAPHILRNLHTCEHTRVTQCAEGARAPGPALRGAPHLLQQRKRRGKKKRKREKEKERERERERERETDRQTDTHTHTHTDTHTQTHTHTHNKRARSRMYAVAQAVTE